MFRVTGSTCSGRFRSVHVLRTRLYSRGGQTFSTEGHIENFIAVGGPRIYFFLLKLQFLTYENMN